LPSLVLLLIATGLLLLTRGRSRVVLVGLTVGGAAGWLLEMFGLVLVDGGEGTYVPLVACFAPILLPELMAPSFVSDTASTVLLVIAPLLYSAYGVAVACAARRGWGSGCFATVVVMHHIVAAIVFGVSPLSDVDLTLQRVFTLRPWWVIATALLFVGIHVAAWGLLFAWQRRYRATPVSPGPNLTRRV
jgi:hypothetical protein